MGGHKRNFVPEAARNMLKAAENGKLPGAAAGNRVGAKAAMIQYLC
jgi:hypothetical protein